MWTQLQRTAVPGCSDISGTDVDCRVFEYKGETYEVAPKEMLADATLHAVFGRCLTVDVSAADINLPEKLEETSLQEKQPNLDAPAEGIAVNGQKEADGKL